MPVREYPCRLKIYLLANDLDENIYAGSTAETKKNRMCKHHDDYMRRSKTSTLHKHIEEIGWEHFYMKVIDEFDCPDAKYAGEAENTAIQIWGNLNDQLAWVAPEERKEHLKEMRKKYKQSDRGKETEMKYRRSDLGKRAGNKRVKKYYSKLSWIDCDFCDGHWKTNTGKNVHEKSQKHIDGVAAFDVESHRLAKEVLGMYL